MRYLLDTNTLSARVWTPQGPVARRLREIGEAHVYTSVVVAAELRFGAARKGSRQLTERIDALLSLLPVEPWQSPFDRVYATVRAALEQAGTPIGGDDLLIGTQALASASVLVTDNTRDFERIAGLGIENWLRP